MGKYAVEAKTADVRAEAGAEGDTERLSWARYRKPILLVLSNHLGGINAMLYYLNDIFAASGGTLPPDTQAIVIGVFTLMFLGVGLMLIDRRGRRTLLSIGSAGTTVALGVAGFAMEGILPPRSLLAALIVFIVFFRPSSGAVIWVYISDVFPTQVRSQGGAIGASSRWGFNAVIALIFPSVAAMSLSVPFYFFATMMALQFVVVRAYFPETNGVPSEMVREKPGLDRRRDSISGKE